MFESVGVLIRLAFRVTAWPRKWPRPSPNSNSHPCARVRRPVGRGNPSDMQPCVCRQCTTLVLDTSLKTFHQYLALE